MAYRHRSPDKRALRSQHLMRLSAVADRLTNGVPTDGFMMAIRICHKAGCSVEDMAAVCPTLTLDQLKEWSQQ
jgi:hypothetical protein